MVNRYFNIANLLLITAGVYLLVNGFYTIVISKLDSGAAAPRIASSSPKASPGRQPKALLTDYRFITDRDLFQTAKQEVVEQPQKVDIETLKQTDLKLKLWGTVTRKDGKAYAVIEDTKTRQQELYRTGDAIQNATVKIILREKVVLTVGDSDEILTMEEIASGKSRYARGGSRPDRSQLKLPVSSYGRKITLNREVISRAMENLGELMEQATIRPHIENGRPAGISITGIKPNAIFRRMRLRNGDIITGFNGRPIESVEDAVNIFDYLTSSSEIKVEIKRRGRQQTIDYRIE
jgi:general secretion pathway protein C